MSKCSLTMIPYRYGKIYEKGSITIELTEGGPPQNRSKQDTAEQVIEHLSKSKSVFSDLSYEFQLNCEPEVIKSIKDVQVYINDEQERSEYQREKGIIRFPGNRWIFRDCYGYTALALKLITRDKDNPERGFRSEYLPVLVRNNAEFEKKVKAMEEYVDQHQEELRLGEAIPEDMKDLKRSSKEHKKSLQAQILLAKEIAVIYESSYGFFKANSRFKTKKRPTVDHLERLQYVSPATLQYTASHPEQLQRVCSNSGLRVNGQVYQPKKTLFMKNECAYDIYENKVIVSFLQKMVDEIAELQKRCQQLLQQIPDNKEASPDPEYVNSSVFRFKKTKETLNKGSKDLAELQKKFNLLWSRYRRIFGWTSKPISREPKSTAIFMSVPQYNRIFVRIHQWFNLEIYDFKAEEFMSSLFEISALYEYYLLAKMIVCLKEYPHGPQNRKYVLSKAKSVEYTPVTTGWKYKNTACNNTFIFKRAEKDGKETLTLYYQPVIYAGNDDRSKQIGLCRNTSVGVNYDGGKGSYYYVPDFIIKVENEGTRYLIIDAKFSNCNHVKSYYVKDLAFKYLFSLSTVDNKDEIAGLCIIYGKCEEEDTLNVYDIGPGYEITPFAKILPISAGVAPDRQHERLCSLFRTVLRDDHR